VTAAEYRQALDVLPYGKRLPGAVYLIDPGEDSRIPSLLRITVAELRKRLEIGAEFSLLKFHTASPKISFLAYPDFEKDPHPALAESVIVDLVTGKTRRDDYRARANPPILHRKETFLPPEHPLYGKFSKLTRQEEVAGLLDDTARIGFRINWERILAEKGLLMELVGERFGRHVTFHTCSAMGMDLDGLLRFLETRDKVRIKSGVVYPGGTPVCEH
jgi:DNA phosphorothioation-associated putative methyltransferase